MVSDKQGLRKYIASEPLSQSQLNDLYDMHANKGAGRWERRILGNLEALQADLAAARAENERLRAALAEFIAAGDDIWAATDGVGGDVPTYNQMRRISQAMDAVMALGLDPDAYRAARGSADEGSERV